jgi:rusticyanin
MGVPVRATSPAAARALSQRVATTGTIDRRANTITYQTRRVELVALASPDSGPDMTWTVDGLVNPTVVIPTDAEVTVHFFNADNGTIHGWELTNTPPPYPYMAMMDAPVALPGAFAMPVSGATDQRWFGRTAQFTATNARAYYYICPVPGQAQKRMHSTLVVR